MMSPHKITNPIVGMVCDMRVSPAAIAAKMIITNGLGTSDHIEKPAGKCEAANEQRKANKSARLENWFVGLLGHVSLLLHHNMRHALGVVNG